MVLNYLKRLPLHLLSVLVAVQDLERENCTDVHSNCFYMLGLIRLKRTPIQSKLRG
jgi:hypothetical protein